MKPRKLLLFVMLLSSTLSFSVEKTVSATSSSTFVFTPQHLQINEGDIVSFVLNIAHNASEVSLETYNNNQANHLNGGFSVDFGGGSVSDLQPGIHYYVCTSHASMGMKGTITVTALGVNDFQLAKSYHVFPNPANDSINLKVDDNSNSLDLIYSIIDINGRQILAGRMDDISSPIDISQFKSGVYFLQLGDDKRQSFKIVKK